MENSKVRKLAYASSIVLIALITSVPAHAAAEWTVLTFIQADNNLADFAYYNINDMQKGILSDDDVNILVQWDQPENRRIWRYRITASGKVEDASVSGEMGNQPAKELTDSMRWASSDYPANRYALILWNHGTGVENYCYQGELDDGYDLRQPQLAPELRSWIQIPGFEQANQTTERTILYDDTEGTCLGCSELGSCMGEIKTILGKNLDLLGMDACLMAMLEIEWQVKDSVDVIVASEEIEPGYGWSYEGFINPLTTNPKMTAAQLGQAIVNSYTTLYANNYYAQDHTLSCVCTTKLDAIKDNLQQFIRDVDTCVQADEYRARSAIQKARYASIEMYISEYIDLHSFYAALVRRLDDVSPRSDRILSKARRRRRQKYSPDYLAALDAMIKTAKEGMNLISDAVLSNATGPLMDGAHGLSIYFPRKGEMHASYADVRFGKEVNWEEFVKTNMKAQQRKRRERRRR
ncbi:MAG: hypothetical protein H6679_00800 [Epsilonproteobacteria bacterium]|nr:hypothetical protein [Campylobacterota bacterium]